MKKDILVSAGIDYDAGLGRYMGNSDLFERILKGFAADPKLEEVLTLYRAKDYERLADAALEIKSVSGTLGMTQLSESADCVARLLHEKKPQQVGGAIADLEQQYRAVLEALREALA